MLEHFFWFTDDHKNITKAKNAMSRKITMNMLFSNLYKSYISYTDIHLVAQAYKTAQVKKRHL